MAQDGRILALAPPDKPNAEGSARRGSRLPNGSRTDSAGSGNEGRNDGHSARVHEVISRRLTSIARGHEATICAFTML